MLELTSTVANQHKNVCCTHKFPAVDYTILSDAKVGEEYIRKLILVGGEVSVRK